MEGIQLAIKINTICIVGGGFAGWYTAAALSHNFPNIKINVIDSDKHARLGVGETLGWSAPYDWKRLLGLKDDRMLMWRTGAIYKYGLTATDFWQDNKSHSYGKFFNLKVNSLSKFYGKFDYPEFYEPWSKREGDIGIQQAWMTINQSNDKNFDDYIMEANETSFFTKNPVAPINAEGNYVLRPDEGYSYHIDAEQTVGFLKELALANNCTHINCAVVDFNNGIILEDGRSIIADLYLDASGFSRILINKVNNTWKDAGSEYCNAAWVCPTRYHDPIKEMTGGTEIYGEDHGWRFKVKLYHRVGNGYIYNRNMVDDDIPLQKLLNETNNLRIVEPRQIKWSPGYYETNWIDNVIPLGISAGFVDPYDAPTFDIHSRALEDLFVALKLDTIEDAKEHFNKNQRLVIEERNLRLLFNFGLSKRRGAWWDSRRAMIDMQQLEDIVNEKRSDLEKRLPHFWHQMYYRMSIVCDVDRKKFNPTMMNDSDRQMAEAFFAYNKARNQYISQQQWPNYYEWLKKNRFNGLSSDEVFNHLCPQWAK